MSVDIKSDEVILDLRSLKYACCTDHFTCPICRQPFLDPVTTLCGHTFCRSCIEQYLKISAEENNNSQTGLCPLDRAPIDALNVNDLFPSPLIISNMIDELQVYCLNLERGCQWKGMRWEVESHVRRVCGFTRLICNGILLQVNTQENLERIDDSKTGGNHNPMRCKKLVERRFVREENECAHRLFACKFCGTKIDRATEEIHLNDVCLLNMSSCDMCGNDSIVKKDLIMHQEKCILTGKQVCPAREIGCVWTGTTPPSLELHLQDNGCVLNLILPHLRELESRVANLESERDVAQRQLHIILDSVTQGKVTNLGYSEPLEEIGLSTRENLNSCDEDHLLHLDCEIERLRCELDHKVSPFISRETKKSSDHQTILNRLTNDNFIMKEELSVQRSFISSLRKQIHYLSFRENRHQMGTPGPQALPEWEESHGVVPSRSNSDERLNLKL